MGNASPHTSRIQVYLPDDLHQQLERYQVAQGIASASGAVCEILRQHFTPTGEVDLFEAFKEFMGARGNR